MFQLVYYLWMLPTYNLILIQNPPFLPALIATYLVGNIRFMFSKKRPRIMVDWHNLGFKMFEESLGSRHLLVWIAKLLEVNLSSIADDHICVSNALKNWLRDSCALLSVTILYDRPAAIFKAYSVEEIHCLLTKLNFGDTLFSSE